MASRVIYGPVAVTLLQAASGGGNTQGSGSQGLYASEVG